MARESDTGSVDTSDVQLKRAVSIWNDSGGVGKTTATANVAEALARRDNSVLVIDLDPQAGGLTDHAGYEAAQQHPQYNIVDALLLPDRTLDEVIIPANNDDGLAWDLIPGHTGLANFDTKLMANLAPDENPLLLLRQNIEQAKLYTDYDYIILDCQASRGRIIENAVAATLNVVIPTECSRKGARAVDGLVNYISEVQRDLRNASGVRDDITTGVLSIVPNMAAKNGHLDNTEKQALEHLFREHQQLMPPFYIPSRAALSAAWTSQKTLLEYFEAEDTRNLRANEEVLPEMFDTLADYIEAGGIAPVDDNGVANIPPGLLSTDETELEGTP